jgi:hypothetical protein
VTSDEGKNKISEKRIVDILVKRPSSVTSMMR